jgi:hypothetical protein
VRDGRDAQQLAEAFDGVGHPTSLCAPGSLGG